MQHRGQQQLHKSTLGAHHQDMLCDCKQSGQRLVLCLLEEFGMMVQLIHYLAGFGRDNRYLENVCVDDVELRHEGLAQAGAHIHVGLQHVLDAFDGQLLLQHLRVGFGL